MEERSFPGYQEKINVFPLIPLIYAERLMSATICEICGRFSYFMLKF